MSNFLIKKQTKKMRTIQISLSVQSSGTAASFDYRNSITGEDLLNVSVLGGMNPSDWL